ncbi:Tos8p [Pelobates cultripes]|uniref:Tos8p n=1 Tax=Pelobates cultripes TaxID=61616 RepID=A0AAD1S691_PELCU|nr:Tos8p [Pelobates cultripes]
MSPSWPHTHYIHRKLCQAIGMGGVSGSTGTSNARNEPGTAENCKHLPKIAVSLMYKWLEDNCEDPYPKDIEKAEMIEKTGLTRKQIEDWFINARRRALHKMTPFIPTALL